MRLKTTFLLLPLLAMVAGCSTYIDDDLSDCPPVEPEPAGQEHELNYELRLVTNITTEINTQLNTTTDVNVANALRTHLKDIFTDFAHDVDLSFYDTDNEQERLSHDQHVMDASERSYTLYLPMREYMHLAVANLKDNQVVALRDDERCPTAQLALKSEKRDTIDSHATGLFTARQPMEVLGGVDQTFHVKLYMANAAAALVIDPRGHSYKDLRVYTTGFATQFLINDSTYTFAEQSPVVRTARLDTEGSDLCFCSVNYPSPDEESMRTVIERDFGDEESDKVFWQFRIYATETDGTVTETLLDLHEPLNAGQLKIIKGWMSSEGAIETNSQEVTATVTLDWKEGGQYNPEF